MFAAQRGKQPVDVAVTCGLGRTVAAAFNVSSLPFRSRAEAEPTAAITFLGANSRKSVTSRRPAFLSAADHYIVPGLRFSTARDDGPFMGRRRGQIVAFNGRMLAAGRTLESRSFSSWLGSRLALASRPLASSSWTPAGEQVDGGRRGTRMDVPGSGKSPQRETSFRGNGPQSPDRAGWMWLEKALAVGPRGDSAQHVRERRNPW